MVSVTYNTSPTYLSSKYFYVKDINTDEAIEALVDTWGQKGLGGRPQYFGGQWPFVLKNVGNVMSSYQTKGLPPNI